MTGKMPGWLRQEPFRQLPIEAARRVAAVSERVSLAKGEVLFPAGEPAKELWVILSGWVRLVRRSPEGQVTTVDIITPKDPLCGLSAFIGGTSMMATAVAGSRVEAVRVPTAALQAALGANAPAAAALAGLLNRRYHRMAEAYTQAFSPVEKRISHMLLRLEESFGRVFPLTKRDVAELSGTTVETAIRTMGRFQKEGWVRSERGRIELVGIGPLKKLAA